ncbi:membrane protein [Virgisporangium aliadipatigenens]|uniref:Membrane protein n=1 Tax=Virgisporangium aliadipatigenens TaxID=741659 RepID=A0A8J3YQB1_9ACTN|nr:VTT domain-containing protein [Virgisporangium aliadipatigenens]GIJ47858.1 membrane protein [Virgisporangium aliadipatigenens]
MVTNLLGLLLLVGLCGLDGVLPMVPSDAAVLTAGVLGHEDPARVPLIVAATALGVFTGDHLAYGIGRGLLGSWLVGRSARVGRAVGAVHARLERRAGPLIVASRFVPGGRVTVNLACGTARLPLRRFSPASAVAALAWAVYITGLGYAGGAAFAGNPLLGIAAGFGLSLTFGGVLELIRRRARPRTGRTSSGETIFAVGPGA